MPQDAFTLRLTARELDAALTGGQWGIVFAFSLAVIPAAELYKALVRLVLYVRKKRPHSRSAARPARA